MADARLPLERPGNEPHDVPARGRSRLRGVRGPSGRAPAAAGLGSVGAGARRFGVSVIESRPDGRLATFGVRNIAYDDVPQGPCGAAQNTNRSWPGYFVFGPRSGAPATANGCACECIDADGEIDPGTCERDAAGEIIPGTCAPRLDDLECCASTVDDPDPAGTWADNGGLPGGCVAVDGVASVNGRLHSGGVDGCADVGVADTTDVTGGQCAEDGLHACRLGGCTTTTLDAPEYTGHPAVPVKSEL